MKRFDVRPEKYRTLQEAAVAARKLGIISYEEYCRFVNLDPRLPANPYRQYWKSWISWPHFLGTKPYETLEEASEAAARLGIKTSTEYRKRYKKDKKLSSSPNTKYSKEWRGWAHFLREQGRALRRKEGDK